MVFQRNTMEYMDQLTFKVEPEVADEIDEEAEERHMNRSEYLRQVIHGRHDDDVLRTQVERLQEQVKALQAEYETLQDEHEAEIEGLHEEWQQELNREIEKREQRIDRLEAQIERLQRTNLKILETRDEVTDLQRYVDDEREWKEASWVTRQKWKLFGRPTQ